MSIGIVEAILSVSTLTRAEKMIERSIKFFVGTVI
jgi:hypothetical protein